MRKISSLVAFLAAAACSSPPAPPPPPAPSPQPVVLPSSTAVTPAPRDSDGWRRMVADQLAAAKRGGHRIAFVGDSITEGWGKEGKAAWDEFWAPRGAINLGIGGDRTQHVLWRLDHDLLAALAAPNNDIALSVVMIGTNNSNGADNTAEQIGHGIVAVVQKLRSGMPKAKVLLLAVFPRGEKPDAQRAKNAEASRLAASMLAGDPMVVCRDIGARFLGADGSLSKDVMPDLLHLNAASYRTWAEAIVADVDALAKR